MALEKLEVVEFILTTFGAYPLIAFIFTIPKPLPQRDFRSLVKDGLDK
jgi:hypothetical protein